MGLFTAPNSAGVMNSLPPTQRGAGAGMLATFVSSASVLSIGVFFSLMIVGLSSGLPAALHDGLVAHGVAGRRRDADRAPPAGLDALRLVPRLQPGRDAARAARPRTRCRAADARTLTGRSFFPHLISGPFHTALVYAFVFAILACLVAAVASLLRGGKYHHAEEVAMPAGGIDGLEPVEPVTVGGSPLPAAEARR